MRNNSQRGRSQQRIIDLGTSKLKALANSLIEYVRVSSFSTGADELGSVTTNEDESITIIESYGFTSRAPGTATAVVLAPGGETQERVALGFMAPAGKPATAAGDAIAWTASGHSIKLTNDGSLKLTSKDGAVIELPGTGGVVVTAASLADITLVVDGGQTIKLGDATATLGVARLTDPVGPTPAMAAWGLVIETFINGLVPGTFTPANSFAGTVQSSFGTITNASTTTLSK
jgi:hypothetical protein